MLAARKPHLWILHNGRVPSGRLDVTTVGYELLAPSAPAIEPDAHRPLALWKPFPGLRHEEDTRAALRRAAIPTRWLR